ncbi:MAG: T9SS type A sorting domain-containing protein [Chlorobi bacterium]|nr:T9SS type A sorting domain-containing protein [Chlorobiota bacterium]
MKTTHPKLKLHTFLIFLIFSGFPVTFHAQENDTLQVQYSVIQCDSLIEANADNPNLVVLDVRTPGEYVPEHLTGAINRNFYDADFADQIDALPRHKLYVVYCRSGSRSKKAFNLMVEKNFMQVVNMKGGILAWISNSLPTTPDFAPLQMAVSDTIIPNDTTVIGTIDTINLTVTNRANDTLRFISVTTLTGEEFSTNFDTTATLPGAEDYTFSIFYNPVDENTDSVDFIIESNGGTVGFHIRRTGAAPLFNVENPSLLNIRVYSNVSFTTFEFILQHPDKVTIYIYNQLGGQVDIIRESLPQGLQKVNWSHGNLNNGIYFYRFQAGKQTASGKMVVVR